MLWETKVFGMVLRCKGSGFMDISGLEFKQNGFRTFSEGKRLRLRVEGLAFDFCWFRFWALVSVLKFWIEQDLGKEGMSL